MSNETIVAVYDTAEHAANAVRDLEAAGVPNNAISQHNSTSTTAASTATTPPPERGFWANLFGDDQPHETHVYDRSIEGGSTVVTVRPPETLLTQAMDILERHNPVDLEERAASFASGSTSAAGHSTATPAGSPPARDMKGGEEVIPLSEEQLSVGKRLINRGTTRVRRFVVEAPVEENVSLHSERVSVERRAVAPGTPVTDTDFTDRTIEATETDEEAVVQKTARVKEEVVINRAATDRVETVRDTVRREDVEITRDGQTTGTSATPPVSPNTKPNV